MEKISFHRHFNQDRETGVASTRKSSVQGNPENVPSSRR